MGTHKSVLLLGVDYAPLRTIALKRAVILILQEKAEIIEMDQAHEVRSPTTSIPMPTVVRLKYFVKIPYKSKLPLNRRAVMTRDNVECQFNNCDRKGTTIDHVIPRSKGGEHSWLNVVAACPRCNAQKANHSLESMGWTLKRQPFVPRGTKWLVMGVVPREEWEPYLATWATA